MSKSCRLPSLFHFLPPLINVAQTPCCLAQIAQKLAPTSRQRYPHLISLSIASLFIPKTLNPLTAFPWQHASPCPAIKLQACKAQQVFALNWRASCLSSPALAAAITHTHQGKSQPSKAAPQRPSSESQDLDYFNLQ